MKQHVFKSNSNKNMFYLNMFEIDYVYAKLIHILDLPRLLPSMKASSLLLKNSNNILLI